MLVFNEGVPRAGKSYDAVKSHILPALKKGRRVFARLNGLDHDRIADYLKLPRDQVRDLLQLVDTKDVVEVFQCYRDDSGKWCIADQFKNALIVIDEVHEFYVNERKPLPPAVENFWALLGQNGGDAVILTQWINRLHSAVKARIEKKNSFQKLSAVGMEGKYLVTYHQTVAAGKFEKIGSETKAYDPAIFPLYHGYAPGADNTEVYKEGGTNVWRAMAIKGSIFLIVGVAAVWVLASFFLSGGKGMVEEGKASIPKEEPTVAYDLQGRQMYVEGAPVTAAPVDPLKDLTAEQRYVAELADRGRIRLSGRAEFAGRQLAVVEWVDPSGIVQEALSVDALRALGYVVSFEVYGVRLAAGEHVLIATPWPREAPIREPQAELYNTSTAGRGAAGVLGSVATEQAGGASPHGYTLISKGEDPPPGS